ncbi:YnbE family lipoprotein [Pseudomonas nitroreducens]|uniref:YnbE family lipoprotein n=1 Tax=Pseudomonas nitroreducens TaxID=46680 RepID=A0A5R8ZQE4_PSENT|nr:YnbE family lipoprotein [Pseudomonas nitroreducens]TLP68428.1 YnbE family lipoprotein [Pseudomonas nitroreducens]
MRFRALFALLLLAGLAQGCTPTVQLAAPKEPININLNVKIEHEIYIKVDKALDGIINENSGLF